MQDETGRSYTVFEGHRIIARGGLVEAARGQQAALESAAAGQVLIFDDVSGRQTDADPRWPVTPAPVTSEAPAQRGRGRPKLGVVPREITLLPRHWDWLSRQSGGASAALRRLVDAARRDGAKQDHARIRREAAYAFISAIGGDLPDFEDVSRALFAGDAAAFERRMAAWPADVRDYSLKLLSREPETEDAS